MERMPRLAQTRGAPDQSSERGVPAMNLDLSSSSGRGGHRLVEVVGSMSDARACALTLHRTRRADVLAAGTLIGRRFHRSGAGGGGVASYTGGRDRGDHDFRIESAFRRQRFLTCSSRSAASALAQHEGPRQHTTGAARARASRKVTMEQLHQSGGCRSGGSSRCPAATRRRAGRSSWTSNVLQAPRDPGRDLPGVGRRRQERRSGADGHGRSASERSILPRSILAPNAVVLDGPGYTGPDGKSVMPELRRQPERPRSSSTWSRS